MQAGLAYEHGYIAAGVQFHVTVAEATGNRVAAHLMHAIRDQVQCALGRAHRIHGSPERSLDQARRARARCSS